MKKPTQLITPTLKAGIPADQVLIRRLTVEQSGQKDNFSAGVRYAHYGTNVAGRKIYGWALDDSGMPTQQFTDLQIPDVLGMAADGWTNVAQLFAVMEGVASALFVFGAISPALAAADAALADARKLREAAIALGDALAGTLADPRLTNVSAVQSHAATLAKAITAINAPRNTVKTARDAAFAQVARIKTLTAAADVDLVSTEVVQIVTDQSAAAVAGVPAVRTAVAAATAAYNQAMAACVWAAEGSGQ